MTDVDAVAKAIYCCRPRRIEWDDLSEIGWKAESRHMARAAIEALGLMEEHQTREDGSGGISSRYDYSTYPPTIVSTTTSGRTPTVMRRWVTKWEVFRKAVEYSHTTRHSKSS